MVLHNLIDTAFERFIEQAQRTPITLLHPNSRYRSIIIARLIDSKDIPVFYYALGPDDIKLEAFISGITHDLANQHATFGRHINMLPQDIFERPISNLERVLETFAADFAEMSDQPFFLVLDEYDRSDTADDIQHFIEKLAGKLPPHCHLVINSRTLPRLPWIALIAHNQAVLLEDENVIQREFYGPTRQSDNGLEVFGLGPGFVVSDAETVGTWEGHLPRLLFFFALDRPIVTRSEICGAFWPELDSDQAVNVFHVTKRRLHKALNADVLIHDDGYYRVNPDLPIYYDVIEFTSALMDGRNNPNEEARFRAWQTAADMYRGPFLQGHNDRWIKDRRADFRAGYLEALVCMAQVWIARDRHEQALTLFQKAAAEDNRREDIHQDIMRLYARLGRRSEAVAHYQRLVEELAKEKLEPSASIQTLYREMIAG